MASDYWTSTQCNHWLLNHAQLAIARAEDLQYVSSPAEYDAIRIWLVNCVSLLTKRLSLRQRVTATSIVFFHRFYSCSPANSFSSTDPALVASACVYVASKVEETPVHIRNVAQESAKLWAELGYWDYPNDVTTLAEMEFYLLEDLHFHLIVHHPYRSLVAIHTACGKGATKLDQSASAVKGGLLASLTAIHAAGADQKAGASPSSQSDAIIDTDLAYGSPGAGLSGKRTDTAKVIGTGEIEKVKQLDRNVQVRVMQEMIDERHKMFLYGGADGMPLPRIEELDDQVLQMAWFVLNDTYRTDVLLLYPPHLIAVSAIFLAITLHDATREKMMRSKKWMDERQDKYHANLLNPNKGKSMSIAGKSESLANEANDGKTPTQRLAVGANSVNGTTPPLIGASPPKPLAQGATAPSPRASSATSPAANTASTTPRMPLRGLASLPPKPSTHYRPQQGQQHGTQSNTPAQMSYLGASGASPIHATSPSAGASPGRPAVDGAAGQDVSPFIAAATATAEISIHDPPVPPPDALTFLAALNVDLGCVAEIVQEMLRLYDLWHKIGSSAGGSSTIGSTSSASASAAASNVEADALSITKRIFGEPLSAKDISAAIDISNGADMLARLKRMREQRRKDLASRRGGDLGTVS